MVAHKKLIESFKLRLDEIADKKTKEWWENYNFSLQQQFYLIGKINCLFPNLFS